MVKKKKTSRKFLEICLIFGGLLLLSIPLVIGNFTNPQVVQAPQIPQTSQSHQKSLPLRVIIPQVLIDLPIKEAKVEGNNWEIFEDAASYLITSAKIGQEGNTVIYAHAKPYLFGSLKKIRKGGRIYILIDDGWVVYEVAKTEVVPPTKTEIVFPTKEKTLTLYTCANFLDKDRFIVRAKLVNSSLKLTP